MNSLTRRRPLRSHGRSPLAPSTACARCSREATILRWCRAHAEEKADELLSRFVRRRDGACVICGERKPWELQAAHVLRRRYMRIRWNPANLIALCGACHHAFDVTRRREGLAWVRDNRPGLLERLEELKDSVPTPDLAEIITRYGDAA